MILADKIINERKKNGWSQEEFAEMLGVSRQAVSKWEGAQSAPDLQKILKMAELFGVSTDYLLKDEIEPDEYAGQRYDDTQIETPTKRKVSLEDASEYLSLRKSILPMIGIGVCLCITCPVILILLSGLQAGGVLKIGEGPCAAIGLLVLFIQIGTALFIFLSRTGKLSKYDFLEQEAFETGYGVDGMVKEKMAAYEPAYTRALTTGVMLCVLGVVPLVLTSVMNAPSAVIVSMVCLLLIAVAVAVYLFIAVCGLYNSYKILLQTDDFTPDNKRTNNKLAPLSGIYWMFITVVYLAVSFITMRWDRTWIIWAVSGILFALIRIIAETAIRAKD